MSEQTLVLGTPHKFILGDKTYEVSQLTQDKQAQWEMLLFAKARDGVRLIKELLTQEEYLDYVKRLHDDFSDGEFGFYSKKTAQLMTTAPGHILLCAILFGVSTGEMIDILSHSEDKRDEALALVKTILNGDRELVSEEEVAKEVEKEVKKKGKK